MKLYHSLVTLHSSCCSTSVTLSMPTCTCADSDSRIRVRCVLDAAMCSVMQATLPRSSLGGASSMTLYTVGQHGHDAHLGDAQCEVTSSPPSQQQQQSFVSMTCHGDELSVSTLPMPDVRESLVHHASAAVIISSQLAAAAAADLIRSSRHSTCLTY